MDLQRVALQGQDEDMPLVRQVIIARWVALDEVQAIFREAKPCGVLPLARDRAAVLATEREDLQAFISPVADE